MARGHRSFPPARRVPEWVDFAIRSEGQAQGTTTSFGDSVIGAEASVRTTIVRVRGSALCHMVATAASDSMIVGAGLIIMSAEAFAAGAASAPSPIQDLDSPWLWNHLFVLGPSIAAESVDEEALLTERVLIDGKAQRKIGPNQTLAFVWDALITAGSPLADFNAACRMLVLLS